jgi:hypothetical protein
MKYPREAIMAVVAQTVEDGFEPVDDRVRKAGLDPYILQVSQSIGQEAALTARDHDADPYELVEAAGDVNWLNGVLFGMQLVESERAVQAAVSALRQIDGDEPVPHYDSLADCQGLDFATFEKVGETRMARVSGPFTCTTIDGNAAYCDDGWLAVDAEGHLYPVADSVARKSYALPAPPF